jgi:hypothetical protein
VKALRVVNAAAPQPIGDVLVGDEGGDGFLSHPFGDAHDRFDDELVSAMPIGA